MRADTLMVSAFPLHLNFNDKPTRFHDKKVYLCEMAKLAKNIGLILLLSIATLLIYEVSWCLVDVDVRKFVLNGGLEFWDIAFDYHICLAFTLSALAYSYLMVWLLRHFVKRAAVRWALLSLSVLIANIAISVVSTGILNWWLDYISSDEDRAENFFVFGLIVTFTTTSFIYFIAGKEIIDAERKHKDAEVSTLKAQMNPHFMMNTLGLLGNMTNDSLVAESMQRLANMYHYILSTSSNNLVPLTDELDFLHNYISLIRLRFADNSIRIECSDELDSTNGWFLPMSLQMLAENAIKHNSKSAEHPIVISIYKENDYIVVENNRQPLSSEIKSTKTGLNNLRLRLASVTSQQMSVTSTESDFTVRIPIIKPKFTNERIDHRRRIVEC